MPMLVLLCLPHTHKHDQQHPAAFTICACLVQSLNNALPKKGAAAQTSGDAGGSSTTTTSGESGQASAAADSTGGAESTNSAAQDASALKSQLPLNSGWYVKQVWRESYTNETLWRSQQTADGVDDTTPAQLQEGVRDLCAWVGRVR